jgi:hypothetical protein
MGVELEFGRIAPSGMVEERQWINRRGAKTDEYNDVSTDLFFVQGRKVTPQIEQRIH